MHDRPVTRAAPVVIGADQRITRILFPRPEQPVRARDSFGVPALSAAARIAGVEHVKAPVMSQEVRAFDDSFFPWLVVDNQLRLFSRQAQQIVRQGLRPDRRRPPLRVAVFFPDQVGCAVLIARKAWVDGAVILADDWPMIDIRALGNVGRCDRDAQGAAALSGHIPDQQPIAHLIMHQLRSPEGALCPRRLLCEDCPRRRPPSKIVRPEKRELRRPLTRGGGGPEAASDADDGRVGVVSRNHRIRPSACGRELWVERELYLGRLHPP